LASHIPSERYVDYDAKRYGDRRLAGMPADQGPCRDGARSIGTWRDRDPRSGRQMRYSTAEPGEGRR